MQTNFMSSNQKERKLWESPWGYKESVLINLGLLIAGLALEYVLHEYKITLPGWPTNIFIIIGLIAFTWISRKFLYAPIANFLSSVPAAVSSISFVMLLVLLMGFIPQQRQEGWIQLFGFTHIKNSWPYLFSAFYLLIILGHTIFKRLNKFNLKNIAFFLNHAGLWILVATASLGAADLEMFNMNLVQDRAIYFANDENGVQHQMPFAIKLLDFDIEEYPPSLGVVDTKTSKIVSKKGDELFKVDEGNKFSWESWKFEILKYIPEAKFREGNYENSSIMGATPAVEVKALNTETGIEKTGWVSAGNFMYQTKMFYLDEALSIAMTIPRPKKFSSKIRIFKKVNDFQDEEVIVNKPIDAFGYKIYQVGYDEKKGKWSTMSAIQIVRDPWLPFVYAGIFMILLGSIYLAWVGRSKN
jgi:hypothetical protein